MVAAETTAVSVVVAAVAAVAVAVAVAVVRRTGGGRWGGCEQ